MRQINFLVIMTEIIVCTLVLSLICIGIVKISNYDIRKFGDLEKTHCVTLVEKLKLC